METNTENKEIGYNSVQEFIEAMKEKQKEKERESKNEILISLGLVDKKNSHREYYPYRVNEKCKWDEEVEKYYIDKHTPLEVSDEEYKEILKYAQIEGEEEKPKKSTNWGKSIETIVWIILIIGIIFNLFLMFNVEKPTGIPIYSEEYELAAKAAEIERWGYLVNIIFFALSFPFLIGFAKLVSAAEKYLRK